MVYPTIVIDNFFKNTEVILNLANSLKYKKDVDGKYPGERTQPLHLENYNFFNYINNKILAVAHPNDYKQINYTSKTFFQKISGKRYPHQGWVHKDDDSITAIVYLSNHKNCGTSLWVRKKFGGNDDPGSKKEHFNLKDTFDKNSINYLKQSNDMFEKTLTIDSRFNRLMLFDSNQFHSANNFLDPNISDDRLTLISFISNIYKENCVLKHSINESYNLD